MKKIMAVMVGLAFMTPAASMALPTLTLTSGSDTVVVEDGSSSDLNPLANVVTYIGPVGLNWMLNVTTGQVDQPGTIMDLNSVDNTFSAAAGDYPSVLKIKWTAPYAGAPIEAVQLGIGGTTIGTVAFSFAVNGVTVFTGGPLSGGAGKEFEGNGIAYFTPTGSANFSQIVEITHTRAGSTSFDFSVPEPATLLILAPMLGSGLYWSFRANRPGRKA